MGGGWASGLHPDDTISGVPVWKIEGAKQTSAGSVTIARRTSPDVSRDTSDADGFTELDPHLEAARKMSLFRR